MNWRMKIWGILQYVDLTNLCGGVNYRPFHKTLPRTMCICKLDLGKVL